MNASERRGALIVLAIFALGAARDLWRLRAPPLGGATPAPATAAATGDTVEAAGITPASVPPAPSARALKTPPFRVDLNRADAAALETLPGVGPVIAGRILDYRREHGRFGAVEELLAVRGVGPKSFARLRVWVFVQAPREAGAGPRVATATDPGAATRR